MVIYNARPQQKWLTISGCGALEFLLIFGFFLGEIYKSLKDTLIVLSMMLSVLLIFIVTYFLVIKFANSMFVFDETGFVRKMNKKVVLEVKWEDVIDIGTFYIYDFLKMDCGPLFLGIDYYDENHNQKSLQVAFSAKDAKRLKMSGLNGKLNNLKY